MEKAMKDANKTYARKGGFKAIWNSETEAQHSMTMFVLEGIADEHEVDVNELFDALMK